ncbi:uncharacterized protein G2W53_006444 [Senna tora]|uniref:Uncharacterized protein n=1 Tax=Senna tora TaxID=362788 RepID=A0A835CGI8_9FABA|nr:uncharacterized protein G2W53_006444 [Senna tora]
MVGAWRRGRDKGGNGMKPKRLKSLVLANSREIQNSTSFLDTREFSGHT